MTRFIDCFKKLIVFFYGSFNYCQEDGRKSLIKYNILIKNIVFEINKNSEELLPLVDIKLVFSCLFEKKNYIWQYLTYSFPCSNTTVDTVSVCQT